MKILIVDDDSGMREHLTASLKSEFFTVDTANDGEQGSYLARTNEYDVLILETILTKKSGLQVCREVRTYGKSMPIIMLSKLCDIENKVEAFGAGADDYLTKPYSHRELISRIRAIMRANTGSDFSDRYSTGNLTLDCNAQEVYINKKSIYLTMKEFSLLELLLRNKGKVVSRGMIMEHVWNMGVNPFSKSIETHIMNLRKKIETQKQRYILNIPGRGYKIAEHS